MIFLKILFYSVDMIILIWFCSNSRWFVGILRREKMFEMRRKDGTSDKILILLLPGEGQPFYHLEMHSFVFVKQRKV